MSMTIQNATTTATAKKFSLGNGLAKATGYVGLAAIAYDAHKLGQVRAGERRREAIANSGLDAYMDSKSLDRPSVLMSKAQNKRFDMEMKGQLFNRVRNFFNSAIGYVKGFGESLVNNVVPLALTTATILTKGAVSKASAIGLAAYGTVDVAKNCFGVGKNHYLK